MLSRKVKARIFLNKQRRLLGFNAPQFARMADGIEDMVRRTGRVPNIDVRDRPEGGFEIVLTPQEKTDQG